MPRERLAFEGFCMYSMTESMIAASTWFILDHKEWRSFLQVEANKENTYKEKSTAQDVFFGARKYKWQ